MKIHCTACPNVIDVSSEDPDASYQDAVEHAERRHAGKMPHEIMRVEGDV